MNPIDFRPPAIDAPNVGTYIYRVDFLSGTPDRWHAKYFPSWPEAARYIRESTDPESRFSISLVLLRYDPTVAVAELLTTLAEEYRMNGGGLTITDLPSIVTEIPIKPGPGAFDPPERATVSGCYRPESLFQDIDGIWGHLAAAGILWANSTGRPVPKPENVNGNESKPTEKK